MALWQTLKNALAKTKKFIITVRADKGELHLFAGSHQAYCSFTCKVDK